MIDPLFLLPPLDRRALCTRYAKIRDEDNWLIIDEKTADIKLNKMPDRESKFLKNGTYYAEVICITNGEFIEHMSAQLTH